jgi:DNA-binding PadR family transcriptional regulator
MFGFGWRGGRRRGLRTWVLVMLQRSPKTGAEIMNEIEGMTQGWWRPSPGSIYPLLDELTADGLIKKRDDGRYEVTQKGKDEVEFPFNMMGGGWRATSVDDMLKEIKGYLSYFEDLDRTDRSKLDSKRPDLRSIAQRFSAIAG